MQMTNRQPLARLAVATLTCIPVILGFQLLPQNDYQPSRPLYMALWLTAAIGLYVWSKRRHTFLFYLSRMLVAIFSVGLIMTLLM
jgi:hypothetical protein